MSTINIVKGSTYSDTLRWASGEVVLKQAALLATTPLTLTCTGHGLTDGWYISFENHPVIDSTKLYPVVVVDTNTLKVRELDGSKLKAGTFTIKWNAPVDMSGYTARMQIKDKVGGTVLLTPTITIDNTAKTITREISAALTAAVTWKKGVFDLEMVSGTYVIKIDSGSVTVTAEVTT